MYILILWFPLIEFTSNVEQLIFRQEFSGIQLGYQGFNIWYPKLKTGIVKDTRIPPISNPEVEGLGIKYIYMIQRSDFSR
jgi:hypothetical protein